MVELPGMLRPYMVAATLESCPEPVKNLYEQRVDLCYIKPLRFGDVCYHSIS